VEIEFDQAKRDQTFADRGLAFEDAAAVFAGPHFTVPDDRRDYGEPRFLTFGQLRGRTVNPGVDSAARGLPRDLDEVCQ
jgi:uncharacterized protein